MSELKGDKDGWLDLAKGLDDPIEFLVSHTIQAFLKSTRGERGWDGLSEEPVYQALCQHIANTRATGWRKIDYNAIKLGDEMMVTDGKYIIAARWESVDWNEFTEQDCRSFVAIGGYFEFDKMPTHWMPLPDPPAGEEE